MTYLNSVLHTYVWAANPSKRHSDSASVESLDPSFAEWMLDAVSSSWHLCRSLQYLSLAHEDVRVEVEALFNWAARHYTLLWNHGMRSGRTRRPRISTSNLHFMGLIHIWGLAIIAGFSSAVICSDRFCPFQWHQPVPLFLSCSWQGKPFKQDLAQLLKYSSSWLIATVGRLLELPSSPLVHHPWPSCEALLLDQADILQSQELQGLFAADIGTALKNRDGPNCSVWVRAMMWVRLWDWTCAMHPHARFLPFPGFCHVCAYYRVNPSSISY